MNTSMQIGFSQRIQLDWLEHTAALVLQEKAREQIAADVMFRQARLISHFESVTSNA